MTPEKQIQNKIIKYLNSLVERGLPVFFERRQAGGFSYKKGIPDLYAVINGRHVEIEIKKPGGRLSTMQEKFKNICRCRNIAYICTDNIEDFEKFIETIFK